MGNKFDFSTAETLCELLIDTADTMESENTKMQHNFDALHESFRDSTYDVFKSEFSDADKTIADAITALRELNIALRKYSEQMREAL
ncbi:hypothetical protein [Proteiniborus sp.]|uniref:WXG100 family type VII secretion target n=1 Tax=Proteiniborus sp. TaxID=2079015 RepID=UPI00332AFE31